MKSWIIAGLAVAMLLMPLVAWAQTASEPFGFEPSDKLPLSWDTLAKEPSPPIILVNHTTEPVQVQISLSRFTSASGVGIDVGSALSGVPATTFTLEPAGQQVIQVISITLSTGKKPPPGKYTGFLVATWAATSMSATVPNFVARRAIELTVDQPMPAVSAWRVIYTCPLSWPGECDHPEAELEIPVQTASGPPAPQPYKLGVLSDGGHHIATVTTLGQTVAQNGRAFLRARADGLGTVGDYSGALRLVEGDDRSAIELKVTTRHSFMLALLCIVPWVVPLAYALFRFNSVLNRTWGLRDTLDEAIAKLKKVLGDGSRGYDRILTGSIKALEDNLTTQIQTLENASAISAHDETLIKLTRDLDQLGVDADAWVQLPDKLAAIEAGIRSIHLLTTTPANMPEDTHLTHPVFLRGAAALLTGKRMAIGEWQHRALNIRTALDLLTFQDWQGAQSGQAGRQAWPWQTWQDRAAAIKHDFKAREPDRHKLDEWKTWKACYDDFNRCHNRLWDTPLDMFPHKADVDNELDRHRQNTYQFPANPASSAKDLPGTPAPDSGQQVPVISKDIGLERPIPSLRMAGRWSRSLARMLRDFVSPRHKRRLVLDLIFGLVVVATVFALYKAFYEGKAFGTWTDYIAVVIAILSPGTLLSGIFTGAFEAYDRLRMRPGA